MSDAEVVQFNLRQFSQKLVLSFKNTQAKSDKIKAIIDKEPDSEDKKHALAILKNLNETIESVEKLSKLGMFELGQIPVVGAQLLDLLKRPIIATNPPSSPGLPEESEESKGPMIISGPLSSIAGRLYKENLEKHADSCASILEVLPHREKMGPLLSNKTKKILQEANRVILENKEKLPALSSAIQKFPPEPDMAEVLSTIFDPPQEAIDIDDDIILREGSDENDERLAREARDMGHFEEGLFHEREPLVIENDQIINANEQLDLEMKALEEIKKSCSTPAEMKASAHLSACPVKFQEKVMQQPSLLQRSTNWVLGLVTPAKESYVEKLCNEEIARISSQKDSNLMRQSEINVRITSLEKRIDSASSVKKPLIDILQETKSELEKKTLKGLHRDKIDSLTYYIKNLEKSNELKEQHFESAIAIMKKGVAPKAGTIEKIQSLQKQHAESVNIEPPQLS